MTFDAITRSMSSSPWGQKHVIDHCSWILTSYGHWHFMIIYTIMIFDIVWPYASFGHLHFGHEHDMVIYTKRSSSTYGHRHCDMVIDIMIWSLTTYGHWHICMVIVPHELNDIIWPFIFSWSLTLIWSVLSWGHNNIRSMACRYKLQ